MLFILSFLALLTSSFAFHPITVPNHALVGHVYRSLQDVDWFNCIQSCQDDPNCFSYNFVRSRHGLGLCQMIDCGLEGLCNSESLVFSTGAVFQQIAAATGTEICESSLHIHDSEADFSLLFPSPQSVTNYVSGFRGNFEITKLSACFWIKTIINHITVFSYTAGTRGTKELVLEINDSNYLKVTVGEEPRTILLKGPFNDGKWHHICLAWDAADGELALFRDGLVVHSNTGFKTDYVMLPGGTLVLGQEQIAGGKHFDSTRSFVGELADFNLWRHYVKAMEVSRMSKSCFNTKGDLFQWSKFRRGIKGKVKFVRPSSCRP